MKGDSLRRQLEKSRKWASEQGLQVDETLPDLGISACNGAHRARGALGVFFEALKEGRISKGSVLLVIYKRRGDEQMRVSKLPKTERKQLGVKVDSKLWKEM